MGARPLGSVGKHAPIAFSVPAEVAAAARDGLRLRSEYGRGGTDVGIDRAKQLSTPGAKVTLRDVVYIRSYFARHAVDNLNERNPPSNGWIAWQLWGGFAGQRWAEKSYAWAVSEGLMPSKGRRQR